MPFGTPNFMLECLHKLTQHSSQNKDIYTYIWVDVKMLVPGLGGNTSFTLGPASYRRCKINFSIPIPPTLYNPSDREFWTPAIYIVILSTFWQFQSPLCLVECPFTAIGCAKNSYRIGKLQVHVSSSTQIYMTMEQWKQISPPQLQHPWVSQPSCKMSIKGSWHVPNSKNYASLTQSCLGANASISVKKNGVKANMFPEW